jgi:hypothetical protein
VVVVGGKTCGAAAPASVLAGCGRLAALSSTELLGVEFTDGTAGSWNFAGATPLPDLRFGGEALLDALAALLGEGARPS